MTRTRNAIIGLSMVLALALTLPVKAQVRIQSATLTSGVGFSLGPAIRVGVSAGQSFSGLAIDNLNAGGAGFWYTTLDALTIVSASVERLGEEIPAHYELHQNYPNPFNPTTRIKYGLPESARVRVSVYNVLGQIVTTIVDREQAAGFYEITWNAESDFGVALPSGLYFYRIETKNFSETRSMVFQK